MVHLLGTGFSFPTTLLSDDFLRDVVPAQALERQSLRGTRVVGRRSALPTQYIADTRNVDLLEGRRNATCSPTTLAVSAIEEALSSAGIQREQIGLIVADSATPFQTCPSEAQRIGGALGLKVPAYDVVGGASAFSLFLDLLASWDSGSLPPYSVWVSTNTPTLHVRYDSLSAEPFIYGDAAAAVVVSSQSPGRLSIVSSRMSSRRSESLISTIDRFISFDGNAIPSAESVSATVSDAMTKAAALRKSPMSKLYVIGPQICEIDVTECSHRLGLENVVALNSARENGFSLGSAAMVCLASVWNELRSGDVVSVSHLGDRLTGTCELVVSESE